MCNEKNLIEFFLLSIIIVQISLYVLPWWIVIFNLLKVGQMAKFMTSNSA